MKKEKRQLTPEELLKLIKSKCDEEGECWIWKGARSSGRKPYMRHPNDPESNLFSVRSIVLDSIGKKKRLGKMWATNKCNDSSCVSPNCAEWRTQQSKMIELGALGRFSEKQIKSKQADIRRSRSNVTWELVRYFRAQDSSISNVFLAKQAALSSKTVENIRNYKTWIEYEANPFAGLFTRLAANDSFKRRA